MPNNCCGGASCACKIVAGSGISVTGSGSPQDPFLIATATDLQVQDNVTFNLTLTGGVLSVAYANSAKLDHIPDVDAPAPTNGQVLGWNSSLQKWTPRSPTSASPGAVNHDTSLNGDGSAGSPLAVKADTAYKVTTRTAGVGLTDQAMNELVRRYPDTTARSSAAPAPVLNALSMLDSEPGDISYWDGAAWTPVRNNMVGVALSGPFMAMSGPWDGVSRLTHLMKNLITSTDADGVLEVLAATDLTGRSGVMTCQITPFALDPVTPLPWTPLLISAVDHVDALAFSAIDGSPFASLPVGLVVDAWVY